MAEDPRFTQDQKEEKKGISLYFYSVLFWSVQPAGPAGKKSEIAQRCVDREDLKEPFPV